jgi:hypothetical protein
MDRSALIRTIGPTRTSGRRRYRVRFGGGTLSLGLMTASDGAHNECRGERAAPDQISALALRGALAVAFTPRTA